MRQSIATHTANPTNSRGTRVIARSSGGLRLVVAWDHALDTEQNHKRAAHLLTERLGWPGRWVGGASPTGFVFVNVTGKPGDEFTN